MGEKMGEMQNRNSFIRVKIGKLTAGFKLIREQYVLMWVEGKNHLKGRKRNCKKAFYRKRYYDGSEVL